MSVLDKFLDVMRLSDDDYDFNNEEYDIDEEIEEEKPSKVFSRKEKKNADPVMDMPKERPVKNVPKITPITKPSRKQNVGMEVCVIKPSKIDDEVEIADTLLNGRTVILNMEGLNLELAQRIIDFTSGATYALSGNLQKISTYIFLATPNGVDISGDIMNLMDSFDSTGTAF